MNDAKTIDDAIERIREAMPPHQFAKVMMTPAKGSSSRELFRDSCAMLRAGVSADVQRVILLARFNEYYRPIEDREIDNAIANASNAPSTGRRYPEAAPALWTSLTKNSVGCLERLKEMSTARNPGALTTGAVIDRLFKADDLICLCDAGMRSITETRAYFAGDEESFPFIVPSAMSARSGLTRSGKISPRTLANVGPRSHAVIEFDVGSLDEQAAVILHLVEVGPPLKMVVFSGGKSLHSWFETGPLTAEDTEKFLRYSALCGADTATFNPVQLVRNPNARRDILTQQTVQFLA